MDQSARYETVSKIEAAERQLRVAIRMFFERKDLIAVHTLAAAAQGVLTDLARSRGIKGLFQRADEAALAEHREAIRHALRAAQNFFKHADNDPDAKLHFFPEATKFHLFDAVLLYLGLRGRLFPEAQVLFGWCLIKFPEFFNLEGDKYLEEVAKKAKQLQGDADDFDLLLYVIDHFPREQS